jgi:hypothetical protein
MTDNKPKDDGDIEMHITRKFDVQQKLGKGVYFLLVSAASK